MVTSGSQLNGNLNTLFPALPKRRPITRRPTVVTRSSSAPTTATSVAPTGGTATRRRSGPTTPRAMSSDGTTGGTTNGHTSVPTLSVVARPDSLFFNARGPRANGITTPRRNNASSTPRATRHTSIAIGSISHRASRATSTTGATSASGGSRLGPMTNNCLTRLGLSSVKPGTRRPHAVFSRSRLGRLSTSVGRINILRPVIIHGHPTDQVTTTGTTGRSRARSDAGPFTNRLSDPCRLVVNRHH